MAGTYTVTVTNANGCSKNAQTSVTVNALPNATAGNNGPVCVGATLTLSSGPSGMSSYSWSGPNGFTSTLQNPTVSASATTAMAGMYTVTVTNGNGCSNSAQTTVTVKENVATPTITVNTSTPPPFATEFKTTTSGATIYYTTDGQDPTPSSSSCQNSCTVYITPGAGGIKAYAVKEGMCDSDIAHWP
jgi:hypothetical protein